MNPGDVTTDAHQRIAAVELWCASAATCVDREAKAFERVERRLRQRQGGNGRNLPFNQLGDKRVLFADLRVSPPCGPIEFSDNRRRVIEPNLVDAVFVTVYRQQAAVAANPDAFERVA